MTASVLVRVSVRPLLDIGGGSIYVAKLLLRELGSLYVVDFLGLDFWILPQTSNFATELTRGPRSTIKLAKRRRSQCLPTASSSQKPSRPAFLPASKSSRATLPLQSLAAPT